MHSLAAWIADTIAHDAFLDAIFRDGPTEPLICARCRDAAQGVQVIKAHGTPLCRRCAFARGASRRGKVSGDAADSTRESGAPIDAPPR